MSTEVGFIIPDETAQKLVQIEGVDKVLTAIVDYMDRKITGQTVLEIFDTLTRRVSLPGYYAAQIGRGIFAAEDEPDDIL